MAERGAQLPARLARRHHALRGAGGEGVERQLIQGLGMAEPVRAKRQPSEFYRQRITPLGEPAGQSEDKKEHRARFALRQAASSSQSLPWCHRGPPQARRSQEGAHRSSTASKASEPLKASGWRTASSCRTTWPSARRPRGFWLVTSTRISSPFALGSSSEKSMSAAWTPPAVGTKTLWPSCLVSAKASIRKLLPAASGETPRMIRADHRPGGKWI